MIFQIPELYKANETLQKLPADESDVMTLIDQSEGAKTLGREMPMLFFLYGHS